MPTVSDYLLWYTRDVQSVKYRPVYASRYDDETLGEQYKLTYGDRGLLPRTASEGLQGACRPVLLTSSHEYSLGKQPFHFRGKEYLPGSRYWSTSPQGLRQLERADRLLASGDSLNFLRFLSDFPLTAVTNL